MRTFYAFLKKERMEQLRTGRLLILIIVFVLFGIMNPAIAKLTPWMLKTLSGSLAETGITITDFEVSALTSWTQFYKNLPVALIIFVLITSGSFTAEYQKGTLVLVLTKGLQRIKVLAAKALTMILIWTTCYFLCYFVTFGYTAFFWDNGAVVHLAFSAGLYWLFGVWVISVMIVCSAAASSNTGVLLGTGGAVLAIYLLGLLPGFGPVLPLRLTAGMSLLTSAASPGAMVPPILLTTGLIAVNSTTAALVFRKRKV
jgi:ABC-2 type transport system permease protein